MNSTAARASAQSPQPALELIALAQLPADRARRRLRALLLANPNYFGKIPPISFSAVLNIQEDTTYESISRLRYDPEVDELSATIDVKQKTGYSSEIRFQGSEEFVRFYLSYNGGSRWHDIGMRSVVVADANRSQPPAYEVVLPNVSGNALFTRNIQPKIRAILSWSTPPPTAEPDWTPLWGHVAESDMQLQDLQRIDLRKTSTRGSVNRSESSPTVMSGNALMDFTSTEAQMHSMAAVTANI